MSALRQSNSRLLSSESKYRERADHLQSQLTLAQSSLHSQQQTRTQIAALTTELHSMESQMQAMRAEVERREEEMRRVVGDVEEGLRRKKEAWRKEREELRRAHDERERELRAVAEREVELRAEEARRMEAELKEVSAKHRQEWQVKEEQLFQLKEDNLSAPHPSIIADAVSVFPTHLPRLTVSCCRALSTELETLRAEVAKSGHWQSERSRLEAETQRLTAAAARSQAEVRETKQRMQELKLELAQQAEVSDVSERYIEQLKLEMKDKDDAIGRHSSQLSALQSLVQASQAAVQREQQQSLKALEVMQSELNGYREVHLSMVSLYDVQMQQMREQLQSVLIYVLDAEESAKRAGGGDNSGGISTGKVVDMMQLCMQQIQQQDLLIQAMSKRPHRPSTAAVPPPAVPTRAPSRAAGSVRERRRVGLSERKRPAGVEELDVDTQKLVSIPLTARISHLQLQLAHTEQQLASQRQRAAQQTQQAEQAREDSQRTRERAQELQRQLSHERAEGKRREREIERATKELQLSQRTEAELLTLTRQVEDGQAALKAAKEELHNTAEQLQGALGLVSELREAVQQAQLELAEKEQQLQRHHRSAQKNEAQLAEVTKELEELRLVDSRMKEEGEGHRLEAERVALQLRSAKEELAQADATVKAAQQSAENRGNRVVELTYQCQRMWQQAEQRTQEEEQLKRETSTMEKTSAATAVPICHSPQPLDLFAHPDRPLAPQQADGHERGAAPGQRRGRSDRTLPLPAVVVDIPALILHSTTALCSLLLCAASLEQRVDQLTAHELTLQRMIEEQRSTHSHLLHFLRELLQPHLLRLQSAYSTLHRQHQRRVAQRDHHRRRVEEERRQRQTQAGLDVSSVSAAASQAGLDLSVHEVEELMQASREVEGRSEEEQREEEELHRRNRLLQEVTAEWDAAFAAAAADAPRFSSAWSERIAHIARSMFDEELRIERMEGQQRHVAAAAGDSRPHLPVVGLSVDPDGLVLRYQQTVAEVKARLTEQHVSHQPRSSTTHLAHLTAAVPLL